LLPNTPDDFVFVFFIFILGTAGGTGVVDTAVLILTVGDVIRHIIPALLWAAGKLDCLLD